VEIPKKMDKTKQNKNEGHPKSSSHTGVAQVANPKLPNHCIDQSHTIQNPGGPGLVVNERMISGQACGANSGQRSSGKVGGCCETEKIATE
jgi:hypothetical protein